MPLSTWNRIGLAAGGLSKGLTTGIRSANETSATEQTARRTAVMEAEEKRKSEEYASENEFIPLDQAKKMVPDDADTVYLEQFARSIGIIQDKDGISGLRRRDGKKLVELIKSPQIQQDMADHRMNFYGQRLEEAQRAVDENPYNADALQALTKAHRATLNAKISHPAYREMMKERGKPQVVAPGASIYEGGKFIQSPGRSQKITSNVAVDPQTKKPVYLYDDGSLSDVEAAPKPKGEGSELADELRRQRLQDMKDKKERDKEQQDYTRKERLDKEWQTKEDKITKQYDDDFETKGEAVATENWNKRIKELQKDYKDRYKRAGYNLDGSRIDEGSMEKLPAKQGEQVRPTQQPGKKGETAKSAPVSQKGQIFQKPDGSHVVIGPDGAERPVELKDGKVIFKR